MYSIFKALGDFSYDDEHNGFLLGFPRINRAKSPKVQPRGRVQDSRGVKRPKNIEKSKERHNKCHDKGHNR